MIEATRRYWHFLIPLVVLAAGLTIVEPLIWLVLLLEGLAAPLALVSAAGWGAWPARWLGLGRGKPGKEACAATALGLGIVSTLTLALGAAGALNQITAWLLIVTGFLAGAVRLHGAMQGGGKDQPGVEDRTRVNRWGAMLVLLALAAPAGAALFGACLPPGILWGGEGNAYDVLEYHLQGPREYFEAGRIEFLPHNVYTSFPQQMEMQYLLLMHLLGDAHLAGEPSQILHTLCGAAAVLAIFCWSRRGWARYLAALAAGSTPWLAYMGCMAYVENGMIFFAATAAGLATDALSNERAGRTALAAGLCAGLAGGCKYTALVLVAIALWAAWIIAMRASARERIKRAALFGLGAAAAFSPWLIKNAVMAGNPVYPFAYEWFGGKAWSAEQARQWNKAHAFPTDESRVQTAARELFGDVTPQGWLPSLYGPALFLLAAWGAAVGRSRRTAFWLLTAGFMAAGWAWLTFMPGRFLTPIIIPLAMLGGDCMSRTEKNSGRLRARHYVVLAIALLGAAFNGYGLITRLNFHGVYWRQQANVGLGDLIGETSIFVQENAVSLDLPEDARVWLVGQAAVYYVKREMHYTVPFCRDPWLEYARGATPAECLDWLRERGTTHVVFCWKEIDRLRETYGFDEGVTHEWVAALERAGLRRIARAFSPDGSPIDKYALDAEHR